MIEQFKLWLVRKHLAYLRSEVSRLEAWLELRNVKAFEMANFIPLRKFKK